MPEPVIGENNIEGIGFRPTSLAHVNIYVSELSRSKTFYTDICGLTPVYNEPDINASFFSNGFTHHDVALMQCSNKPLLGKDGNVQNTMVNGRRPGLNHLAFVVPNEGQLVEAYKKALQRPLESGLVKCLDHGISHSIYLHDPDKNMLEFYVDAVEDWRKYYAEENDELLTTQWDPLTENELCEFCPQQTLDKVAGALFQPQRVSRATLLVSNLAAALEYYQSVAGLQILHENKSEQFAVMGGTRRLYDLALVQASDKEEVGLNCFGFDLFPNADLDQLAREIAVARIPLKTTHSGFKQSIAIKDSDGFRLEFYRTPPAIGANNSPLREDLVLDF